MNEDEKTIREYAHHKAGQAVICVMLFGPRVIKHLSVDNGPGSGSGFETYSKLPVPLTCRPPSHRRGEDRKPIEVEGIVDAHGVLAYAGVAAVATYLRDIGQDQGFDHLTAFIPSREGLSQLASSIGLERPEDHFYDEYWDEAGRLLATHWEAVQRVSEGLLTHRTLNGNRVDALILGDELN